ncbi:uncharacterized protein [Epargyreus clarus]|uniref:uncharacterized protein n=1 Tax=Epargyreus clarus TaxID=520877 RepID=UPI003C2AC712
MTPLMIVSSTGSKKIIISDYYFIRHSDRGIKTRWRCGSHHRQKCGASLVTVKEGVVRINNEHNHPPPYDGGAVDNIGWSRGGFQIRSPTRHRTSNLEPTCDPSYDRPTFFTSKIGARIMKLRGYWYTRHSVCSSRVKWLCAESRHTHCNAIVVTIGCMTVDRQNKHTHPPTLANAQRTQTDLDFLQLLDSVYHIVMSDRGTEMLLMEGYRYGLRRRNGLKSWWRCVRHSRECRSMAVMVEDMVVHVKEHNHSADGHQL